ncbi:MAG: hypothetical protein ACM32E_32485 [Gemmatimonadota bacterium]
MPRRSPLPAGAPLLALAAVALVTGCAAAGGSGGAAASSPAAARPAGRPCGSSRTAAGVKVLIMVERGQVACSVAQSVEQAYTAAIASGKVPGNGGGAPVTVQGWVCQGFNTPEVLRTGNASRCTRNGNQIMAVLPSPGGAS